jgi:prepilin-type N-terminal cleavage/methylation domain-containing protein
MKKRNLLQKTAGFTIIEMIVSLALFSVVVTVAIGSLLLLIGSNDDLQQEQSVMTSLSFALDSMSREIRTGKSYYCVTSPSNTGSSLFSDTADLDVRLNTDEIQDCATGRGERDGEEGSATRFHGLAFIEAGDSITGINDERIMYYYDSQEQMIFRRVGAGSAIPILSNDIRVVNADFFVTAAEPLPDGDLNQPAVTIHIEAQAANSDDDKSYFVQTTVAKRTLDL